MAKARKCPSCEHFFNPKFSGRKWGNTEICLDCYLRNQIKFQVKNTPLGNAVVTPNQGEHSLN